MSILAIAAAVGIGVLGNWSTSLIATGFTKCFGETDDPLMSKVFAAANRAAASFFKKYKRSFGKPRNSFLARQENWDFFFNCIRFGSPSIAETAINPQGFKNAQPVTTEAIQFFLTSLEKEMRKDIKLNNLLEMNTHIKESKSIHSEVTGIGYDVKSIKENIETFTTATVTKNLPKALTNKIPRTPKSSIIGRDLDLSKLHKNLFDKKQVLLVNGMGGIGKTTLTQVYIDTYWNEYNHIAWISQQSGDFSQELVNTDGLLQSLSINSTAKKSDELFNDVISTLNAIQKPFNLLVIDNADSSLLKYYDYLPHQPSWHVLVNSRERIDKFNIQEIDFLTEDEAIALFLHHYTHGKISEEKIKQLVKAVEWHTLTIEILAKTAQLHRAEISQLENAITDDLKANVYIQHKGEKIERITSYLCSIFKMSSLNDNEIWLLKQFVCLPAEFHQYELLKKLIRPEDVNKGDEFSETVESLSSKGWLLKNSANDSYKMHRIIADAVKKQVEVSLSDVKTLIKSITTKLSIDQAIDNPVDKFPWTSFGKSMLDFFQDCEDKDISTLQNNLALVLNILGDYEEAKTLLQKAVMADEKNFGTEHPSTATRYSNLASVLEVLGDYQGAKSLLQKAVISNEKNFGTEHPSTAISYSNLAAVLKDLGDFEGAKTLLQKTVISNEINYGIEHPFTAISNSNLAMVLEELGDYEEAKALLQKAVMSYEKNFGIEHPSTAIIYSNLATVLQDLGEYKEAKALLQKAILSAEKNFGTEHPSTARNYSNLASVLRDLGDYQGAKNLMQRALMSDEKNFGTEHPSTTRSYFNLAAVLKDLGDYEGAKALLQKAVMADEKNFGTEHPSTAIRYSNLASVLEVLGDYQGAKSLLQKAVISNEKNFGTEHPSTAISYSNLAAVLKDLGDFEGAKTLLQKTVISNEINYGTEHPSTATNYSNLAVMLKEIGDYKEALKLSQKAVAIFSKVLPEGHPNIKIVTDIYESIQECISKQKDRKQ